MKKAKAPRKKHEPKIKAPEKVIAVEKEPTPKIKQDYLFAVGRRKSAVARVRYYKKGNPEIIVNNQPYTKYFPYFEFQKTVTDSLTALQHEQTGTISIRVAGGGKRGQAEAVRLGISRILVSIDPANRPLLKTHKFLTRDPRIKERKKYGLKKARRAPQWQKR